MLIRNLDERVKARIQRRARRNGRSMEAEAREILIHATVGEEAPAGGLGSEMVALFSGSGIYIDGPIKEFHDMKMRIPDFNGPEYDRD